MRIHWFQHVPFEGLGSIGRWMEAGGHSLSVTRFYEGDPLPDVAGIDLLIVMGGPMNIYEEDIYPWLAPEKKFIGRAIEGGGKVLGICLGAQLIADVLGGKVTRNQYKEIGWFPIEMTPDAAESSIFGSLPKRLTALHWHGDTFALPPGAVRTASSEGCLNQAFVYEGRVVGLQFHLESTRESVQDIIDNCGDELVEGKYIQTAEEIMADPGRFDQINSAMNGILDGMTM